MGLRDDIFADFDAVVKGRKRATWLNIISLYLRCVNFRVAVKYRFAHRAYLRGRRIAASLWERSILKTGAEVSAQAEIGPGVYFAHLPGVVIGSKVRIGKRAYILQGVTLGGNRGRERDGRSQPEVGDDVLIAAGAKVLGPVRIGHNVVIGANSVVINDLPDNSIAVGVPARIIRVEAKPVPLLDRGGEEADLLRKLLLRIEELERRVGIEPASTPADSVAIS